jgi:hypothetical protein
MTLAEYTRRQSDLLDIREAGSACTETISETRVDAGVAKAETQVLDQDSMASVSVRRRGGRPRKWKNEAERLRAYRARKQDELLLPPEPNGELRVNA